MEKVILEDGTEKEVEKEVSVLRAYDQIELGEEVGTAYEGSKGKQNADDIAELKKQVESLEQTLVTIYDSLEEGDLELTYSFTSEIPLLLKSGLETGYKYYKVEIGFVEKDYTFVVDLIVDKQTIVSGYVDPLLAQIISCVLKVDALGNLYASHSRLTKVFDNTINTTSNIRIKNIYGVV